jgi:hypothetical protein
MALDFATRRYYYNRCKPFEPLSPDDERNVDVDNLTKIKKVRGVNWVERLATRIELADEPVLELFSGLTGSGKSTELRRLAARLGSREGANLLPVLVDAEEVVDLANPIDIPDIIAAIVQAVDVAVLEAEGKSADQALGEGYLNRLWRWLTTTDVELQKAEYAIPGGPKLVAEMKSRPSLRARVRATIAAHLTTFLKEARDEIVLLNERARQRGREGLVVIFDSLEKLRGITTNWSEVLGSAEKIFTGGAPYLRLPVHVLYTVPPALVSRFFTAVEFMPMIKLHDKLGNRFEEGYDAAREIVRRRVPDAALKEVLGPKTDERVSRLVEMSGGYPREIVRLLQGVISLPETPLSDDDVERVFNEVRDGYRKAVPADTFEWLARVAVDHYLTIQSDAHRQAADLMLTMNAVMRYLNDNDWFDLHPAVDQIPGVQQAKQTLLAAQGIAPANG